MLQYGKERIRVLCRIGAAAFSRPAGADPGIFVRGGMSNLPRKFDEQKKKKTQNEGRGFTISCKCMVAIC